MGASLSLAKVSRYGRGKRSGKERSIYMVGCGGRTIIEIHVTQRAPKVGPSPNLRFPQSRARNLEERIESRRDATHDAI